MKRITVLVDRRDKPKIEVPGWVPYVGCPLAATRPIGANGTWHSDGWRVTHIASGMLCGGAFYDTVQEALAFIERLQPRDEVWIADNPGRAERARELYLAARQS